jgi:type IV secretory pathway TraG/TraD family ATPase VirD4
VLELPTTKALIFKRGAKPILADQFVYYRDATFRKWSQLKPPAQSDRIHHGIEYAAIPAALAMCSEAAPERRAEVPYWGEADGHKEEKTAGAEDQAGQLRDVGRVCSR